MERTKTVPIKNVSVLSIRDISRAFLTSRLFCSTFRFKCSFMFVFSFHPSSSFDSLMILLDNGNGIDHSSPSNGHSNGEQGEQRKFILFICLFCSNLFS